jgi:hypothetical protein
MPSAATLSASTVSTADTVQFESAKSFGARIYSAKFYGSSADRSEFAPIVLFAGIGLLVAFVAVVSGVSGVWY